MTLIRNLPVSCLTAWLLNYLHITLLQDIKKALSTSSKLEYDFINADLQKGYVHVHLINVVFPDLGIYIVLINAVLKRGVIIRGEVKSVQTKAVASNSNSGAG